MTNNKKILKILNNQIDIKRAIIMGVSFVLTVTIGIIGGILLFQNDVDNTTDYSIQSIPDNVPDTSNTIEDNSSWPSTEQPNKDQIGKEPPKDKEPPKPNGEKPKFRFGRRPDPNNGGENSSNHQANLAHNDLRSNTTTTLSNRSIRVSDSVSVENDNQQDMPDDMQVVQYNVYTRAAAPDVVPPMQLVGGQDKIQKLNIVHETPETPETSETSETPETPETPETSEKLYNKSLKSKQLRKTKKSKSNKIQHNKKKTFKRI